MSIGSGVPGNITATFGSDLYTTGNTSIPNLLMKYYKKLGICDSELLLLIQLFYLRTSKDNPYPSIQVLSDFMTADYIKIQNDLVSLIEKNFLSISQYYDEEADQVRNVYEFESLFEKVSELWAMEKMQHYQKQKELLAKREDVIERFEMDDLSLVYKTFEREFGRLLSPMEIDVIKGWLNEDQQPGEIICEALKKAVLMGKHNFKYIDSILLEWKKNNLRNLESIRTYDENFKKRRTSTPSNDRKNDKPRTADKTGMPSITDKKDKKDKFRLLYMS